MVASMLLPSFEFAAPDRIEAVCALLAKQGGTRLLAGGTDLVVKMKRGELAPGLVVSLARIEALRGVNKSSTGLRIGALTTMAALAEEPLLAGPFAALAEGAGVVGGPNIRNRATVGGNVANARPCADTLPPLIALGAGALLESSRGRRCVAVDGLVTGPGETGIAPDEILLALRLAEMPRTGSHYIKITRRAAMEVTCVGCAAAVTLSHDGERVERARLVLTSVAPVPLRVRSAEALVEGDAANEEVFERAATEACDTARPIDDHRAPAVYRQEMVRVLVVRTLREATARARRAS